MTRASHPLFERLLKRVGASLDEAPSLETWRALGELVCRTYRDADQDRYTIERAMDISSQEMQDLYQEVSRRTAHELAIARESEERHRMLFDANPLPMWLVDLETMRFADVNRAMIETYGYTRDELLAMSPADVKPPEDVPEMLRDIERIPNAAIQHIGLRKHRSKSGALLDMDLTIHAVTIGGRSCMLGIAADMTRSRRIEEELRQAQKMEAVGRLAGGIAHDFNNILAVILSNAELALDDPAGVETAEAIAEIRSAAMRAANLTRQLLMFSRKQKRQPKPVALNSIVTGIEAMLARIVGEDVAMSAMISPDLGTIEADAGEVEQVLMNLVVNARDAMPGGGRVLLETSNATVDDVHAPEIGVEPGRYVVLSVSDTGCGMTPAVRARIFEPFFTTKDVDKGTGLGLATVFGIVKQCRGGITVYSEPDHGTTFRVYWPRTDAATSSHVESRYVPVPGVGTVLLVEDDAQVRTIVRRYLTRWGYALLEAPNGAAALDVVRSHRGPVDLLLTDLVMPGGIDGRTLSRHVLVERPCTKVVFMSGYTEHTALKSAKLGPDDHFVQKPFTAQTLCETIQRALGR